MLCVTAAFGIVMRMGVNVGVDNGRAANGMRM